MDMVEKSLVDVPIKTEGTMVYSSCVVVKMRLEVSIVPPSGFHHVARDGIV